MAEVTERFETSVSISFDVSLTSNQVRALNALAGYGHDAFFEFFYKNLGKAYLGPYEKDLRDLFRSLPSDSRVRELEDLKATILGDQKVVRGAFDRKGGARV